MKLKKLLIIIGVVAFLLTLVVIKNSCQRSQAVKNNFTEPGIVLVNSSMNVFASKITIYKGSDEKNKVILSRNTDGEWSLETRFGLKVKREALANLFNSLNNLRGEERADSKSVFSDFQIQDNEAAHLILSGADGKVLTHLVISFKAPGWNQNFIRESGSDKVMLVNRSLLNAIGLFDKTVKNDGSLFADYKIFSFDLNSVNSIEFTDSKKRSLVLTKTEAADKNSSPAWNFSPADKKSAPDAAKVNEYLQSVSAFYAQDILDPALGGYGFDKPYAVLKLGLLKDGKEEEVRLCAGKYLKEKHSYCVKITPGDQVYIVADTLINSLNRGKSYFSTKTNKAKK
jgi:hypothetical protein